jgi:hypothetical protein
MEASEGRMPKRSGHAESVGTMPDANVRRRGTDSPERLGHLAPRRLETCGHFQSHGQR